MATFNSEATYKKTDLVSPVKFYAEWKGGKDGGWRFVYFDKETGQKDVEINLSNFVILKTGYNIRGYVEKYNTGAWSNEIDGFDEDLIVQTKAGVLARGKYKDIKDKLNSFGLNLHRVLTVLHEGELIGIVMKGAASYEINNIINASRKEDGTWTDAVDWKKYKINFEKSDERKKGAVTYFVPLFVKWDEITTDERKEAMFQASLVEAYFDARKGEQKNLRETPEIEEDAELPF